MKVIQTHAEIGDDRMLHVKLPPDAPTGVVNVLLVLEVDGLQPTAEQRREAAWAGLGALKGIGGSVEEFLAERRADDERRDRALGL
jgi:hypothetical protein